MSTKKNEAQLRGDIIADIEAVRMGTMKPEIATVIFSGYKELNSSVHRELSLFKASLLAEKYGLEFARTVKLGRRVINGEDE